MESIRTRVVGGLVVLGILVSVLGSLWAVATVTMVELGGALLVALVAALVVVGIGLGANGGHRTGTPYW